MNSFKLLQTSHQKVTESFSLIKNSVDRYLPLNQDKKYSPIELEYYDALSDRFIRSIEIFLKFFRSYNFYLSAESTDTIRDLLNRMEKLGLISSTNIWMEMREIRNKIVHDYLPDQIYTLYESIINKYWPEIENTFRIINSKVKHITNEGD